MEPPLCTSDDEVLKGRLLRESFPIFIVAVISRIGAGFLHILHSSTKLAKFSISQKCQNLKRKSSELQHPIRHKSQEEMISSVA